YLWATPEHIAILREEAARQKLRITSLAGGFGETEIEFRACCRLASELDIRILGGGCGLLQKDRSAMVRILREFGLIFALENHPEKSPSELLHRLGAGDEDVMKVAVDTGWFGTQGFPADQALEELAGRIAVVHLKDVKAAGEHETCALGAGVVPIHDALRKLRAIGYHGPISIEHEPFSFDPLPDCREALTLARRVLSETTPAIGKDHPPVRVALLGCGNIATTYLDQIRAYPEVKLLGVTDIDLARAKALAEKHDVKVYPDYNALLADPEVEVVLNLSIHHAHHETTARALRAGKHVHVEKPIALTSSEAKDLVTLAAEKRLRLGSAPTTWLGEAQRAAWRLVAEGAIGTPRVAYAEVNWGRIESWHPNPAPFYAVGPVFDVGVYPITLLTAWFGPVQTVVAGGGILYKHRMTNTDLPFEVASPDWTAAVLDFASGFKARITCSFYVENQHSQSGLEVHGDKGALKLDRWDVFDTPLKYTNFDHPLRRVPLQEPGFPGIEFARGVQDVARAIREERPHLCTGEQAAHVVEVCEAILEACNQGSAVRVHSSFTPPLKQLPFT
ncbi:MAG: Gfo/Idh/MocA family oxidoreductase, partial [Verrucomicrobiia bacterium]